MNTNAVHETYRLLPADSVAYDNASNAPGGKNRHVAAYQRWGAAMNTAGWGWRVAVRYHTAGESLPASLCEPYIRRAYRYLQGARDDQMAMTHALKSAPGCSGTRLILQGLLCAKDISLEGIASLLQLDPEVVRLFEALFFSVRDRGDGFRATVMFPETRIGAVIEAEMDYHETDLMLMRAGRDHGWKAVARLAGLAPMQDPDETPQTMLAEVEMTIAANTRILALAGHLNRKESPGFRHGKALLMRPKSETEKQQTDDDKIGLGSFGMKAPVLEHFRRITETETQYRLQLQRARWMRDKDNGSQELPS